MRPRPHIAGWYKGPFFGFADELGNAPDPGANNRKTGCLRFEHDVYEEFHKELPAPGSRIVTRKGQGKVLAQEILARKVLVEFEDGRRVMVLADEILTRMG